MSARRWIVWVLDARGWRCFGAFPEGFAEAYARSQRFAKAYALEAA